MNAYQLYNSVMGSPITFNGLTDTLKLAWIKVESDLEMKILENITNKLNDRELFEKCLTNNNNDKKNAMFEYFHLIKEDKMIDYTLLTLEKRQKMYDEIKEECEMDCYVKICKNINEELYDEIFLHEINKKKRVQVFFEYLNSGMEIEKKDE
jgi:hypothetical protein